MVLSCIIFEIIRVYRASDADFFSSFIPDVSTSTSVKLPARNGKGGHLPLFKWIERACVVLISAVTTYVFVFLYM